MIYAYETYLVCLSQCTLLYTDGWDKPSFDDESIKGRIVSLLYSARTLMKSYVFLFFFPIDLVVLKYLFPSYIVPLIAINIVCIVLLIIFG